MTDVILLDTSSHPNLSHYKLIDYIYCVNLYSKSTYHANMKIFLQINQIYHILLLMKAIITIMYFDLCNIHLLTLAYVF